MSAVAVARHRPVDNPFASHRVEGLAYRCTGFDLEGLRNRLEDLGGRAAIVGPEGSGKTTLLEDLATTLAGEAIMVRIPGSSRRPWRTVHQQLPTPVTSRHAILIDSSEQLGPLGWRRLMIATRHAGFLVATLHRPCVLPTLIACRTDRELLSELVAELAPADSHVLEPRLDELFERHRGNIRLCLRELYDVYAGRALMPS